mmetsp:Transcript_16694/g.53297  ORF Transcript_16694/g.53297 Transcript_16694/m.53297 type:complete len:478 (-) Transcript_16694:557-1990(-)
MPSSPRNLTWNRRSFSSSAHRNWAAGTLRSARKACAKMHCERVAEVTLRSSDSHARRLSSMMAAPHVPGCRVATSARRSRSSLVSRNTQCESRRMRAESDSGCGCAEVRSMRSTTRARRSLNRCSSAYRSCSAAGANCVSCWYLKRCRSDSATSRGRSSSVLRFAYCAMSLASITSCESITYVHGPISRSARSTRSRFSLDPRAAPVAMRKASQMTWSGMRARATSDSAMSITSSSTSLSLMPRSSGPTPSCSRGSSTTARLNSAVDRRKRSGCGRSGTAALPPTKCRLARRDTTSSSTSCSSRGGRNSVCDARSSPTRRITAASRCVMGVRSGRSSTGNRSGCRSRCVSSCTTRCLYGVPRERRYEKSAMNTCRLCTAPSRTSPSASSSRNASTQHAHSSDGWLVTCSSRIHCRPCIGDATTLNPHRFSAPSADPDMDVTRTNTVSACTTNGVNARGLPSADPSMRRTRRCRSASL